MRFVWAIAAFFLAAVLIGAGIAQRTVLHGPSTEQASISVTEELPYTLIHGEVFNKLPGTQTLMVRGDGTIFAAYGRTSDMQAWLADTDHNEVTLEGAKIVSAEIDASAPGTIENSADDDVEDAGPALSPLRRCCGPRTGPARRRARRGSRRRAGGRRP